MSHSFALQTLVQYRKDLQRRLDGFAVNQVHGEMSAAPAGTIFTLQISYQDNWTNPESPAITKCLSIKGERRELFQSFLYQWRVDVEKDLAELDQTIAALQADGGARE